MIEVKKPINVHKELTVGQVAARSGVAVTALHFYETKGLIKSTRNQGNQRRYPREVLRRVALIKVAQRLGIPLAEIGEHCKTYRTIVPRPRPTGKPCQSSGVEIWMSASINSSPCVIG